MDIAIFLCSITICLNQRKLTSRRKICSMNNVFVVLDHLFYKDKKKQNMQYQRINIRNNLSVFTIRWEDKWFSSAKVIFDIIVLVQEIYYTAMNINS